MFKRMFSKQSLAIFKEKKLMIAITAVIFIPLLYAGMFLWAFWDPYDRIDDIPVAIVNEDLPYEFEGELFELGRELVDRMKDEEDFDFHFVDREVGYEGLESEDYYILIEIPKDFSKNATTLMDDDPRKLRLKYVPNESYNFLASQMGETGMLQIEQALEENIIETYTETIFDKIDEVADGLKEAEDATKELDDGAGEIRDNTRILKDHLHSLAESSIEFVDGTGDLKQGAGELLQGTTDLNKGVNDLYDASGQLLGGAKQLREASTELKEGLSSAQSGASEINDNIPKLIEGINALSGGLRQLEQELPKQIATEINQAIEGGAKELATGLHLLEDGIIDGLGAETNNELGLASQLSQGLNAEISKELRKAGEGAKQIPDQIAEKLSHQLAEGIARQQEDLIRKLAEAMGQVGIPEEEIAALIQGVTEASPSQEQLEASLQAQIVEGIQREMPDIDHTLSEKEKEIQHSIERGVFYAVGQTEKEVAAGFSQFSQELDSNLAEGSQGIEEKISEGSRPAFSLLQEGSQEIKKGQQLLEQGMGDLSAGTAELSRGAGALTEGQNTYLSQFNLFTKSFAQAREGSTALAEGSLELHKGVSQIDEGAHQIKDGTAELADGSEDLAAGTDSLKEGTAEFYEEMSEAAREAGQVNSTEKTYEMMADPVEVDTEKINEVPNYGTGFAPYFISLGLYVGALLLSIVYPLRAPTLTPTSGFNWFLRKTAGLGVIGLLQALLLASLLLFGLGIEVQSVPLFYVYAIFTSWTFIALIQFLVTCFDDPGRFAAIIILILQLTTSAGTFPLELIPKVLQPFNTLLPMTYTVTGFKAVISSGEFGVMWQTSFILAIFTVLSLLLTLSYFLVMYKRKQGMLEGQEA